MKATVDFVFDGRHHPAQDIAWELLMPWIDAQIESALAIKAQDFPKKKRKKMVKRWRTEVRETLALHYGIEAGYSDVLFIRK